MDKQNAHRMRFFVAAIMLTLVVVGVARLLTHPTPIQTQAPAEAVK